MSTYKVRIGTATDYLDDIIEADGIEGDGKGDYDFYLGEELVLVVPAHYLVYAKAVDKKS